MNFMGFLRLYRITGDKSLFRKVAGAWDDICNRQMYITGGVSVAEHYEHGYVNPFREMWWKPVPRCRGATDTNVA